MYSLVNLLNYPCTLGELLVWIITGMSNGVERGRECEAAGRSGLESARMTPGDRISLLERVIPNI